MNDVKSDNPYQPPEELGPASGQATHSWNGVRTVLWLQVAVASLTTIGARVGGSMHATFAIFGYPLTGLGPLCVFVIGIRQGRGCKGLGLTAVSIGISFYQCMATLPLVS